MVYCLTSTAFEEYEVPLASSINTMFDLTTWRTPVSDLLTLRMARRRESFNPSLGKPSMASSSSFCRDIHVILCVSLGK